MRDTNASSSSQGNSAASAAPVNTAERKVAVAIAEHLARRRADGVGFADALLEIADRWGNHRIATLAAGMTLLVARDYAGGQWQ